jgi:hypothetical protein
MKLSAVIDFYVLERIRRDTVYFRPPAYDDTRGKVLASKVEAAWNRINEDLGLCFRDYLFLAAFGEARHAWDKAEGSVPSDLPHGGWRESAMRDARQYDPDLVLPDLYRVFHDMDWHSGYGGEKWASIIKAAVKFGEWPTAVFIDHCVDLEHNGGSCFDKTDATSLMDIEFDFSGMESFLDWKRDCDILDPSGQWWQEQAEQYLSRLSGEVRQLLFSWAGYYRVYLPFFGRRGYYETVTRHEYSPVDWGDEGLSPHWVDVDAVECANCGDSVNYSSSYSCSEGYLCSTCYHEYYTECDHCGNTYHNDAFTYTKDEKNICDNCLERTCQECEGCGEWVYNYNSVDLDGHRFYLCDECEETAVLCEDCGKKVAVDGTVCGDCHEVRMGHIGGQAVLPVYADIFGVEVWA